MPKKQRALVLQGGGALGAYEVGVLKELSKKLIEGRQSSHEDEPLFDIVAGTSMGAMNAAVLVSNVVNRRKTWEEAVKELENFWTEPGKGLSSDPNFTNWWWNDGNDKDGENKVAASEVAARKYYCVKEYFKHGTPRVCTAPFVRALDNKFGDQVEDLWYHHLSKPLEDTIVRYSKDPSDSKKLNISTSWDKRQPRLLVVSVDVVDGKTVTFDSYYTKAEDSEDNPLYEGDGITIDHIMSSGTIPEFYDFREIGGRKFCDGGWLSNTPFRELLQAHRSYWMTAIDKLQSLDKDKDKIPDLEVYIVNVHPSTLDINIDADDHDGVKDRINDIRFFDRNSHYDENVVNTETDYSQIIDKLKGLAEHYMNQDKFVAFESHFENFLKQAEAKSKSYTSKRLTYKDLLNVRFSLSRVVRIEHTGYTDSIFGKTADFTSKSIKDLIQAGEDDASKILTALEI